MGKRRVVVIGGGLAGLTVAKELLKHGLQVVICEARARLGGKAGADSVEGAYEDHGFHVFPAWYLNTRSLLRELDVEANLVDVDCVHHLRKGEFPRFFTYYPLTSAGSLYHNVFHGLLPWHESLLAMYFSLDLCCEPFSQRGFLDRVSVNGLLRSRFYRTEGVSDFHQQTLLQAGAVPHYELSAMTLQKVLQCWSRNPVPIFSMLNGNLHEKLIAPFEARVRSLGAEIRLSHPVHRLVLDGERVTTVEFGDGSRLDASPAGDIFVLATPHEVTSKFASSEVLAAERRSRNSEDRSLSDLVHLRSVPMAGLNLYLNRRVLGIPAAHVNLYASHLGLSFIDVSQHWEGQRNTTLCAIASNFEPLQSLSREGMAQAIIDELCHYIPRIRPHHIERYYLQPNIDAPLLLNTVGSWHFRPEAKTRVPDLYVAGDYCRSPADITTMEGAVMSGLRTAKEILDSERIPNEVRPVDLQVYPRLLLLLMKYAALPVVGPIGLWCWAKSVVSDQLSGHRSSP